MWSQSFQDRSHLGPNWSICLTKIFLENVKTYFWSTYNTVLLYDSFSFNEVKLCLIVGFNLVVLEKKKLDMLKSIEFGDLIRLFSSSRWPERVYLGWFVWDLVGRLLKMQGSRWSVKARQGPCPIGSSLSTGFQVYLPKCWDSYVSPGCTIELAFFWVFLLFLAC